MSEIERAEFVSSVVRLGEAMPMQPEFPRDMSLEDFARMLKAAHKLHRKTAFLVGSIFNEALRRFGQDAYQIVDGLGYAEGTLRNYSRVVERVDPELWNEPLPDRHFFAISGSVKDHAEQRVWVERTKENNWTADELREEIKQEMNSRMGRPQQVKTIPCPHCSGHGFILESEDR